MAPSSCYAPVCPDGVGLHEPDRGDGGESAEGGARVAGEGGGRAEVSAAWSAVAVARLQALFGKEFLHLSN